jgi:hypothetical protein
VFFLPGETIESIEYTAMPFREEIKNIILSLFGLIGYIYSH